MDREIGDVVEVLWEGGWRVAKVCEVRKGDVFGVEWGGFKYYVHGRDMRDYTAGTTVGGDMDMDDMTSAPGARSEAQQTFHTFGGGTMDGQSQARSRLPNENPLGSKYHGTQYAPTYTATRHDPPAPIPPMNRRQSVKSMKSEISVRESLRVSSTPVFSLVHILSLNAKRVQTYKGLPVYLIYLILLSISAGLMYLAKADEAVYHTVTAVKTNLMNDASFRQIATHEDFYAWLEEVAESFYVSKADYENYESENGGVVPPGAELFKSRFVGGRRATVGKGYYAERQNTPLHYMLVRQQKVMAENCTSWEQGFPIAKELWDVIQDECIPSYAGAASDGREFRNNDTVRFGPFSEITGNPFAPDSVGHSLPPLRNAKGEVRTYHGKMTQFTAKLPYADLFLDGVKDVIGDLRANAWIDYQTRVVVVETLLFSAVRGEYTLVRFVIEFTHSGATTKVPHVQPFWILRFDDGGSATFMFVCDLLFSLYVMYAGFDIGRTVLVNQKLGEFPVGFWEILRAAHLVILVLCLVHRYLLWHDATKINENMPPLSFYRLLTEYQDNFEVARNYFLAALWLAWIRCLEFLRYNKRLNAVTETIRLASSDLISLFVISSIVVFSFGMVANGIYGWHLKDFSSIGDSMSWLLRTVFSGDLTIYHDMLELQPTWTPIFLLVYLLLSWLILLNVVLGILAAGFSAASQSTDDRSWSVKGLQKDFSIIAKSMFNREDAEKKKKKKKATRLASNAEENDEESSSSSNNNNNNEESGNAERENDAPTDKYAKEDYVVKRVMCVMILRRLLDVKEVEHYEEQNEKLRKNEIEDWELAEYKPPRIRVTLDELMLLEGWRLTMKQTAELLQSADNVTAESFATAEDHKRQEKAAVLGAIAGMTHVLSMTMEQLIREGMYDVQQQIHDVNERVDDMKEHTDRVMRNVGVSLSSHVHAVQGNLEGKVTAESNKMLGIMGGQRRYLDHIGASIQDSESRVRGDIQQRRPSKQDTAQSAQGARKTSDWRRDLQERESRLRERERDLIAAINSPTNESPTIPAGTDFSRAEGTTSPTSPLPSQTHLFTPRSTYPPADDASSPP
eukprot:TRINITY_DN1436_c0_g3_i1.p1 TRINITY_DN1436_c0_g3~~TRINITY_DN1436_c0_g3_i1.p1  ORF type:complete len:1078 (+),score=268.19 TRINITY_DN1436_c0_g3_i1:40-3273(+)